MLLLLTFTMRQWSLQGTTSRSTAAVAWSHCSCPLDAEALYPGAQSESAVKTLPTQNHAQHQIHIRQQLHNMDNPVSCRTSSVRFRR